MPQDVRKQAKVVRIRHQDGREQLVSPKAVGRVDPRVWTVVGNETVDLTAPAPDSATPQYNQSIGVEDVPGQADFQDLNSATPPKGRRAAAEPEEEEDDEEGEDTDDDEDDEEEDDDEDEEEEDEAPTLRKTTPKRSPAKKK